MIRPENVPVTVDLIIRLRDHHNKILLIERNNPPHGWALPGGFVERGESLAQAAVREAKEETGLDVMLREQFFAYSTPTRDPRGSVVSVCFIADAYGTPVAGDDAKNTCVVDNDDLVHLPPMAFDHLKIIKDYNTWLSTGWRPTARE